MDEADAAELRARAGRYRRLMTNITDAGALEALSSLADECEKVADQSDVDTLQKQPERHDREPQR